MRTASGLTLVALGAILAFAVTAQPSFLDLHVAGWVLMLTGGIGIALPRARRGSMRRRTVLRGARPTQVIEVEETDVEPKFSQLIAPGGISDGFDDSMLARRRPVGPPMAPDGTTKQRGEHDQQGQGENHEENYDENQPVSK